MEYLDGWNPRVLETGNDFTVLCKECFSDKNAWYLREKEISLMRYIVHPETEATERQELQRGVKDFDVIEYDKGRSLLVFCSAEGGQERKFGRVDGGTVRITIVDQNGCNDIQTLGSGDSPKIVKDVNNRYHVFWIKHDRAVNKLVRKIFDHNQWSVEETVIGDMGDSVFHLENYRRLSWGEIYAVGAMPNGKVAVVWENDGDIYEKVAN
jgi:hypothetical protein